MVTGMCNARRTTRRAPERVEPPILSPLMLVVPTNPRHPPGSTSAPARSACLPGRSHTSARSSP
eukprot:362478-Chlamydomonas_euryale.AAC.6